ncbi:hypothetical protein P691DRAFT_265804 [Macrolepiota fuliginosa MF-IS2]|uniref:Uncharacterized protein n=1 Tax=Macrolepiota fuliginosa MF-IS2 TaxID=1400762 RepID=A0A9P5X6R6_9AGAR|nr:hypothetical protein P691DRAFT_265804 [Macrolepiota fuliginosa MF-IS2]
MDSIIPVFSRMAESDYFLGRSPTSLPSVRFVPLKLLVRSVPKQPFLHSTSMDPWGVGISVKPGLAILISGIRTL